MHEISDNDYGSDMDNHSLRSSLSCDRNSQQARDIINEINEENTRQIMQQRKLY